MGAAERAGCSFCRTMRPACGRAWARRRTRARTWSWRRAHAHRSRKDAGLYDSRSWVASECGVRACDAAGGIFGDPRTVSAVAYGLRTTERAGGSFAGASVDRDLAGLCDSNCRVATKCGVAARDAATDSFCDPGTVCAVSNACTSCKRAISAFVSAINPACGGS